MTYHTFRLERRPTPSPFYFDHENYGHLHPPHADDISKFDVQPPIDPNLEYVPAPASENLTWPGVHTHQLQQYMDGPSTSFFTLGQLQANCTYPQQNVNSLPPVAQGRHGSPFSQHHSSSSSDSLSPPTESDILPTTPPDNSATSPFLQTSKYQQPWEARQSHMYVLAGIGHMQGSPCVNPLDVNPSQDFFDDEKALDYDGSMTFSFSSSGSQSEPETQIKDEICVADSQPQIAYPSLDCEERDQSELDIEMVATKHEEEDKDWTPKFSRKRTRSGESKTQGPTTRPARKRARLNGSTDPTPPKSSYTTLHPGKRAFACVYCAAVPFRDEAALQKHVKSKHVRPFVCIFNFAGCGSSFPSKNEWKRHVITQHLSLSYWLCTQDACERCTHSFPSSQHATHSATSTPSSLPRGAIFNRKDLYTQHVRRMHVPPSVAKSLRLKKSVPEWDERLRQLQREAERRRCDLPSYMRCPAIGCGLVFRGSSAWDERMEHVAKHLEKVAEGREPMPLFGGEDDPTLISWAASPEVGVVRRTADGAWELMNPLRGHVSTAIGVGKRGAKASPSPWPTHMKVTQQAMREGVDADGEND